MRAEKVAAPQDPNHYGRVGQVDLVEPLSPDCRAGPGAGSLLSGPQLAHSERKTSAKRWA